MQTYPSATAESPVSQAVRETRRQGTRMQKGEQVRAIQAYLTFHFGFCVDCMGTLTGRAVVSQRRDCAPAPLMREVAADYLE